MSGTSFGRDAIGKAQAVLQRAESEVHGSDLRSLNEVIESLERTLNMFRGVVSKTNLS
jgi:molecular chaperone DnaK